MIVPACRSLRIGAPQALPQKTPMRLLLWRCRWEPAIVRLMSTRSVTALSSSCTTTRLEEIRACAPELPTGWLVSEVSDVIVAQACAMGVTQLCPRADIVTPDLVQHLHCMPQASWCGRGESLRKRSCSKLGGQEPIA